MADYSQFKYGGANFPLTTSTANSLLQDADPSLYYVLDYFASVINTHLSERLLVETQRAPAIPAITAAVAAVVPYDPTPYLQEQNFRFPLLAIHRVKEKNIWKAVGIMDDESEWAVDYILPPLTGGQMERVSPILRSVGRVLVNRIENKMDPSYRDGADVWALANLEEIWLEEASYGGFVAGSNLMFPAFRGKLRVKECDIVESVITQPIAGSATDNLQPLDRIENEEDLVDPADPNNPLTDVVDTRIDF